MTDSDSNNESDKSHKAAHRDSFRSPDDTMSLPDNKCRFSGLSVPFLRTAPELHILLFQG